MFSKCYISDSEDSSATYRHYCFILNPIKYSVYFSFNVSSPCHDTNIEFKQTKEIKYEAVAYTGLCQGGTAENSNTPFLIFDKP